MGITIRDLAGICKVNASTVSRALRDDPRVKPETREMIRKLANEHGYIPNINARNLAAGKTNTIWLVLGSLDNDIERKPALRMSNLLRQHGYDLLLLLHNNDYAEFERILDRLNQMVTDGALIIPPCYRPGEYPDTLEHLPVPVAFIDRWVPGINARVVTTENAESAETLVRFIEKCGAEIFFVGFEDNNPVADARRKSAIAYLKSRNLKFYTDFDVKHLKDNPDVSVAIVSNTGVKGILERAGKEFYEELKNREVYGGFFDYWDYDDKTFFRRAMVCIQNFDEIADIASDTILKLLSGKLKPAKTVKQVKPEKFIEI